MSKANQFPILKKSPIVEATFQVNFAVKPPMTEADAKSFVAKNFSSYSYKENIFSESIAVKKKSVKDPSEAITHQQNWTGSRFISNNRVITVFADGFAFGVLKPYPTDDVFFAEISDVAKAFVASYSGVPVVRLGLRFINRFSADAVGHRPDKLFSTLPSAPSRLGYGVSVQFQEHDGPWIKCVGVKFSQRRKNVFGNVCYSAYVSRDGTSLGVDFEKCTVRNNKPVERDGDTGGYGIKGVLARTKKKNESCYLRWHRQEITESVTK